MEATEVADDLLAKGWAAPVAVGPDPRDFERSVAECIAMHAPLGLITGGVAA